MLTPPWFGSSTTARCPLPPVRAWDVREAVSAFRFVSRGGHIGKNVLTLPRRLDTEGTVLITGGTGVLGGVLARHLVERYGVRHLVLTSRRGVEAAGAVELVAELAVLGADARVVACDVADREALAAVLAGIPAERPLTGVVHAAGVADDGVVESLTRERLDAVLAPKADAALHLHELTAASDLAMFVMYSSVAATFGSPGQANYAAANAVLDGSPSSVEPGTAARRSPGVCGSRPARSVAISTTPTSPASAASAAPSPRLGLALFDAALATGAAHLLPTRLDVTGLRSRQRVPALLRGLVRAPMRRAATTGPAPPPSPAVGRAVARPSRSGC